MNWVEEVGSPRCSWCEKRAKWLQFRDQSPEDAFWRTRGYPGPTAERFGACEDHAELLDRDRFHPEYQPR